VSRLSADLAAHLVNLIDFHRDDEPDTQMADPIVTVEPDTEASGLFDDRQFPSALIVTLESGKRVRLVAEEIE